MLLRLVVYVDDALLPLELEDACVCVSSMLELAVYLKNTLQRPPRVIFYWNFGHNRYELLTTLQTLVQHYAGGDAAHGAAENSVVPAHLWVETRSLQLVPVDPDVDVAEYAYLVKHVRRGAGNKYVIFLLQNALRVTEPSLERLFDDVRGTRLYGSPGRVELLYYANNSLSSSEVLQRGFDRGGGSGGWAMPPLNSAPAPTAGVQPPPPFVFTTSMKDQDDKEVFPSEPHKVLLCEVALGRVWPSDVPFSKSLAPPPPGYDSVCHRVVRDDGVVVKAVRVGRDFQALPRYVLTLVAKKRNRRGTPPREIYLSPDIPPSPATRRRTGSVGSEAFAGVQNNSLAQGQRRRSGSAPLLMNGRQTRLSSRPTDVTCAVHVGTLLGLWCSTCGRVICPYCASVGDHRGHEVASVEGVVGDMRGKVGGVCQELSAQLEKCQRVEARLKSQQTELLERRDEAVAGAEKAFSGLHRLIDSKREEWLARLREQTACLDEPLAEVGRIVQQYMRTMQALSDAWERAGGDPTFPADSEAIAPAAVASAAYLLATPKLLGEARRLAGKGHDAELALATNASAQIWTNEAALFHLDFAAVRQSIEQLLPEKGAGQLAGSSLPSMRRKSTRLLSPSREFLDGSPERRTVAGSPTSLLLQRTDGTIDELPFDDCSVDTHNTARQQLFMRHLSDVRQGHVWCVPNASKYFHHEQRRAVCSGTFELMGLEWELRIQAPDAQVGCGPYKGQARHAGEAEPVGIFLYPVGHTQRLDFRISIFSAVFWAEWTVTGWTASFAGKGWGIYPLLPRRELMQTDRLACNNTLKICLAPTSGVY
ncbi:poly [ADP-ribose] polymerase [Trypanosoma conorhini]|uniref:Poly [ADP-ribose] polymerase n=1 Tax=Trypanosoma conorhini TaxID=83891 RepID=A0A3R7LFU3_9TRYP|nr:poly [ADP-ribose] polymerase [Trypanosoma conorhini]RNF27572.1 poly [ADP-ribose] polymerase [Trypanosoma conorhini]